MLATRKSRSCQTSCCQEQSPRCQPSSCQPHPSRERPPQDRSCIGSGDLPSLPHDLSTQSTLLPELLDCHGRLTPFVVAISPENPRGSGMSRCVLCSLTARADEAQWIWANGSQLGHADPRGRNLPVPQADQLEGPSGRTNRNRGRRPIRVVRQRRSNRQRQFVAANARVRHHGLSRDRSQCGRRASGQHAWQYGGLGRPRFDQADQPGQVVHVQQRPVVAHQHRRQPDVGNGRLQRSALGYRRPPSASSAIPFPGIATSMWSPRSKRINASDSRSKKALAFNVS